MHVLVRPTAPDAAAWNGWAVRRDWPGGHEFVGYRLSQDDAMVFALVDQRQWADCAADVTHSVVQIDVVAYELHAGKLCSSADCPRGAMVLAAGRSAEGVR